MKVVEDLGDLRLDQLHDRTIGYPLFILVTGSFLKSGKSLFYAQLLLHFFSTALLVFLMLHLEISKKLITIFVIFALTPPNVVNTAYMLTGALTQFLLVVGIVSLFIWLDNGSWPWVVLSGVSFAYSALTRPTYQLLFIAICFFILLFISLFPHQRKRLILGTVNIFLISLLLVGGMMFYNSQKFHFTGVSPLAGFHLSTKTVRFVERLPDDYAKVRDILIKYRDERLIEPNSSHTGFQYIWYARKELEEKTKLRTPELSKYLLKLNLLLIRKAPLEYFSEVTRAFATYWFPYSTNLSNFNSRYIQLLWAILHFSLVFLFIGLTVILLVLCITTVFLPLDNMKNWLKTLADKDKLIIATMGVSFCVIFYTMTISILFEPGIARHRTPTDLLIVCSSLLGIDILNRMRKRI